MSHHRVCSCCGGDCPDLCCLAFPFGWTAEAPVQMRIQAAGEYVSGASSMAFVIDDLSAPSTPAGFAPCTMQRSFFHSSGGLNLAVTGYIAPASAVPWPGFQFSPSFSLHGASITNPSQRGLRLRIGTGGPVGFAAHVGIASADVPSPEWGAALAARFGITSSTVGTITPGAIVGSYRTGFAGAGWEVVGPQGRLTLDTFSLDVLSVLDCCEPLEGL